LGSWFFFFSWGGGFGGGVFLGCGFCWGGVFEREGGVGFCFFFFFFGEAAVFLVRVGSFFRLPFFSRKEPMLFLSLPPVCRNFHPEKFPRSFLSRVSGFSLQILCPYPRALPFFEILSGLFPNPWNGWQTPLANPLFRPLRRLSSVRTKTFSEEPIFHPFLSAEPPARLWAFPFSL